MEKKNVTFDDIAKFTGFSKTTISRFFNKPDSLTEKNQKIIKDALDKLGQGENRIYRRDYSESLSSLLFPSAKQHSADL